MGGGEVPRERELAELAAQQRGVVARRQLRKLGFGRDAIDKRVASGRLHAVHLGVYAVGHSHLDLHGRWMAAVLACGPGAVLSHRDAAQLHGFYESWRRAIDLTAPGRSRHKSPLITVHRPRRLQSEDVTIKDRIPVTTVART